MGWQLIYILDPAERKVFTRTHCELEGVGFLITITSAQTEGGLKEQVQQSVNFSEHANHETGHSRLRNIVTTWRLNEPSLPD